MLIHIFSILSTIHPEPCPAQIFNIFFNFLYDVLKLNLWSVTVTGSDLIQIVSISNLLIALLHRFKVITANKTYLKPLFSCSKSRNKLIILLFAKNNESAKLILSTNSTS